MKQHLACIRMLFGWLGTGQLVPANTAHPKLAAYVDEYSDAGGVAVDRKESPLVR